MPYFWGDCSKACGVKIVGGMVTRRSHEARDGRVGA